MYNDIFPMIAFIVIGIFFIFNYSKGIKKIKSVTKNGIEAEGIIFELVQDETIDDTPKDLAYRDTYYLKSPVIRFLTQEKHWVTGMPLIKISTTFFKTGQKVNVIYNSENPEEFLLKTKLDLSTIITLVLIAGIVCLGYGVFLAYNYLKS
ncbi:MAG: hypothetical protein JST96_05715 [Bacteroidetes bacterium]|nr:hypothetical protein [Bacteroidota bacterium]